MLQQLSIRNYALIQELEFIPVQGLNMITGETGAGKSIMLGALGLLLGNRADTKALLNEQEKCVIEGQFQISAYDLKNLFAELDLDYEESCIIRREIAPGGKSRAFVNDTPVTLDILKSIGGRLMDIHSQHETILLGVQDFQLNVLDAYAGLLEVTKVYRKQYLQWKQATEQYDELKKSAEASARLLDYNTFLLNELEEVDPQADEQEKLEQDLKKMENAEDLADKLHQISDGLSEGETSAVLLLQQAEKSFSHLSRYTNEYEGLHQRLNAALAELKDIAAETSDATEHIEISPKEAERIQERLSRLYMLQKKHSVNSNEELVALKEKLEQDVQLGKNVDEQLEEYAKAVEKAFQVIKETGKKLSKGRQEFAPKLSEELNLLLKDVGIPNAQVKVDHQELNVPMAGGWDKVNFLFSANKGMAPQELKQVASGGEFSRLMLCLKYVLAERTAMPTIVFDEIDTGISGEVAIKVGKMMKHISAGHQLIVISHLPQIAAIGDEHFFVYKDHSGERTFSSMRKLKKDERVKEIAQMIGGENPSDTAIKSAKELLAS